MPHNYVVPEYSINAAVTIDIVAYSVVAVKWKIWTCLYFGRYVTVGINS